MYSKKQEKHLWRGLCRDSYGIIYHSLLIVKRNKGPLQEIWRRYYLEHYNIKKLSRWY